MELKKDFGAPSSYNVKAIHGYLSLSPFICHRTNTKSMKRELLHPFLPLLSNILIALPCFVYPAGVLLV